MNLLFGLAHYLGLLGMLSRVIADKQSLLLAHSFLGGDKKQDSPTIFNVATLYVNRFVISHWFPSLTTAYRALNRTGSTQEVVA